MDFFFLLMMEELRDNLAKESTFFKFALEPCLLKEVEEESLVKPFCHWFKSESDNDDTLCFLEAGVNRSMPSLLRYDWKAGDSETALSPGEFGIIDL